MSQTPRLFTELNDDNALDLFLRSPEEFLVSVDAGARWVDTPSMANQFSMAANLLSDAAIKSGTPWFYTHPVLYLYRHSIELYIKALVPPSKLNHDLIALRDSLIAWMKTTYGCDLTGSWAADTITEFATIDPDSTKFRYATDTRGQPSFAAEQIVNLDALKTRLHALFTMFLHLLLAQGAFSTTAARPTPEAGTSTAAAESSVKPK